MKKKKTFAKRAGPHKKKQTNMEGNRMRDMVRFELSKEIERAVFCLFSTC